MWYVAPSYRQAKRIAWDRLKDLTRPYWLGTPHETDLSIKLQWGATIALRGADNYDSLRGDGLDFVVLDEYASMRPECWTEVLRPALSDRQGGALFIGTPQGRNHFFDQYEYARTNEEWSAYQFTTAEGGNVAPKELASAASQLDEQLFRQEFEASFDSGAIGRAYHAFVHAGNVARCEYRPELPLVWSLDFNVNPMCSVVAQRQGEEVRVLDEMVLTDAHTGMACEAFLAKTRAWRGNGALVVEIYGDASGYQRRTCGDGYGLEFDSGVFRAVAGAGNGADEGGAGESGGAGPGEYREQPTVQRLRRAAVDNRSKMQGVTAGLRKSKLEVRRYGTS